jgi:hypothetical protein
MSLGARETEGALKKELAETKALVKSSRSGPQRSVKMSTLFPQRSLLFAELSFLFPLRNKQEPCAPCGNSVVDKDATPADVQTTSKAKLH